MYEFGNIIRQIKRHCLWSSTVPNRPERTDGQQRMELNNAILRGIINDIASCPTGNLDRAGKSATRTGNKAIKLLDLFIHICKTFTQTP